MFQKQKQEQEPRGHKSKKARGLWWKRWRAKVARCRERKSSQERRGESDKVKVKRTETAETPNTGREKRKRDRTDKEEHAEQPDRGHIVHREMQPKIHFACICEILFYKYKTSKIKSKTNKNIGGYEHEPAATRRSGRTAAFLFASWLHPAFVVMLSYGRWL
jgi:hypothetical protein